MTMHNMTLPEKFKKQMHPMCRNMHGMSLKTPAIIGNRFPLCEICGEETVQYCRHGKLHKKVSPCCVWGPPSWLPCGSFNSPIKVDNLSFPIKCDKCMKSFFLNNINLNYQVNEECNLNCDACAEGKISVPIYDIDNKFLSPNRYAPCKLVEKKIFVPMPENDNWHFVIENAID